MVLDVIQLSRSVPAFPVERWFDVGLLAEARGAASVRISWITLFAKAYGLAAKDVPELRRAFISLPWPRFYQSPYSVISVAVNRQVENQDRLFFGRLRWPESKTLQEIQQELDGYANGDIRQAFRQQILGSRMPRPVRRLGWWWRMQARPSQRARRVGTGSISVLAGQGVFNRQHPCLLSSSLSYGPLESDGRMWVTLQCDHRVIDGFAAAQAINRMQEHMQTTLYAELQTLATRADAA